MWDKLRPLTCEAERGKEGRQSDTVWVCALLLLVGFVTSCEEPPPVANAFRHVTSYDVGTNVSYICYQGYVLTSGNLQRTCSESGIYTGEPPVCTRVCPYPDMPGVWVQALDRTVGGKAYGLCAAANDGADGSSFHLVCDNVTVQWNTSRLMCEEPLELTGEKWKKTDSTSPALATDGEDRTCAMSLHSSSHQFQARLGNTSEFYVYRVSLLLSSGMGRVPDNITVKIQGDGINRHCTTVSNLTVTDLDAVIARDCKYLDGVPWGHTVQVTARFGHLQDGNLYLCTFRLWGSPKIGEDCTDYCPAVPEVPGLKAHSYHNGTLYDPDSSVHYFTTDVAVRYVCDGGKRPVNGEDTAACKVGDGEWTLPTLVCTDEQNFAVHHMFTLTINAVIKGLLSPVLAADEDDHTCSQNIFFDPSLAWESFTYHLAFYPDSVVEVTSASLILDASDSPVTAAGVKVNRGSTVGSYKECTSFTTEVTYGGQRKVHVTCPQRPVSEQQEVVVYVTFQQQQEFRVCEVRLFGRELTRTVPLECYQSHAGEDYKGRQSITRGGHTCQPWATKMSHPYKTPQHFPDDSLAEAENFCRNPKSNHSEPWCFINEEYTAWDTCVVIDCVDSIPVFWKFDLICRVQTTGEQYSGHIRKAKDNAFCVPWQFPGNLFQKWDFPDGFMFMAVCRNPGGSQSQPWCYTDATTLDYQHCDVSTCPAAHTVTDQMEVVDSEVEVCFVELGEEHWRTAKREREWKWMQPAHFETICSRGGRVQVCRHATDPDMLVLIQIHCDSTTTIMTPTITADVTSDTSISSTSLMHTTTGNRGMNTITDDGDDSPTTVRVPTTTADVTSDTSMSSTSLMHTTTGNHGMTTTTDDGDEKMTPSLMSTKTTNTSNLASSTTAPSPANITRDQRVTPDDVSLPLSDVIMATTPSEVTTDGDFSQVVSMTTTIVGSVTTKASREMTDVILVTRPSGVTNPDDVNQAVSMTTTMANRVTAKPSREMTSFKNQSQTVNTTSDFAAHLTTQGQEVTTTTDPGGNLASQNQEVTTTTDPGGNLASQSQAVITTPDPGGNLASQSQEVTTNTDPGGNLASQNQEVTTTTDPGGNLASQSQAVITTPDPGGNLASQSQEVTTTTDPGGNLASQNQEVTTTTDPGGNLASQSQAVITTPDPGGNLASQSQEVTTNTDPGGNLATQSQGVTTTIDPGGNLASQSQELATVVDPGGNLASQSQELATVVDPGGNLASQSQELATVVDPGGNLASQSQELATVVDPGGKLISQSQELATVVDPGGNLVRQSPGDKTTLNQGGETTPPFSTTLRISRQHNLCSCSCQRSTSLPISVTDQVLVNLAVDKRTTSGYTRKKTSAWDYRLSSIGIGTGGVVVLVSFLGIFVAGDLVSVCCFLVRLVRPGKCHKEQSTSDGSNC